MKKTRLFIASLACAALSMPLAASAAETAMPDTYFYVGGHVGQYYHDFNSKADNFGLTQTTLPGVQFGWRFSPNWSVQGSWERNEYSWDKTNKDGYLDIGLITGRYHFADTSLLGFEPYVGLAAGRFNLDPNGGGDDNDETVVGPEFGAQTMLTPHLSLDIGAHPLYSTDAKRFDGEIYAGLNFLFAAEGGAADTDDDGVADALDQCANTPAGTQVDASGCALDTDTDGVADYIDQCPATVTGATVDAKGCVVDSDSDGVLDNMDQCPATPAGVAVDGQGCAVDSDGDGVADYADKCLSTPAGALVDDNGCQKVLTKDIKKTLHVEFATNQAKVPQNAYDEIKTFVTYMKQYPSAHVQLVGYTDSVGRASYNQQLSEKRAGSVKNVLVDHFGIEAGRISVVGRGEANPIADNSSDAGRAENRRVEVVLKAQTTKAQYKN